MKRFLYEVWATHSIRIAAGTMHADAPDSAALELNDTFPAAYCITIKPKPGE